MMGLIMAVPTYRRVPRGRPMLGFQLETPPAIALRDGAVLTCSEVEHGRPIGELEVSVFAAALIIDRDGTLAQKACAAIEREVPLPNGATAMPVELAGASGYRAEAVHGHALPYRYAIAMAPPDGIDGGVLVTVRAARPEWPAADHMLQSLRLVTRHGVVPANDGAGASLYGAIDLVGRR